MCDRLKSSRGKYSIDPRAQRISKCPDNWICRMSEIVDKLVELGAWSFCELQVVFALTNVS